MTDEAPEATDGINVREHVIAALKPLLPSAWTLYPYSAQPDTLADTTVWLVMKSIARAPQAPMSTRILSFTLTIATPITGIPDREDDLGESIIDFLDAIDKLPPALGVAWTTADIGMTGTGNLGYDVELTIPIVKQPSPEPPTESE